jgi:hypothetical protein
MIVISTFAASGPFNGKQLVNTWFGRPLNLVGVDGSDGSAGMSNPVVREELVELSNWVIGDAVEDVPEPGKGINFQEFTRSDEKCSSVVNKSTCPVLFTDDVSALGCFGFSFLLHMHRSRRRGGKVEISRLGRDFQGSV